MRSHSKMTLSMPADATYLQVGCRSRDMIDSLCPLRVRMREGSYSLFIILNYYKERSHSLHEREQYLLLFSDCFLITLLLV